MNQCELHFIKCIKSNTFATPLEFDETLIRSQLEYNGILQFIHILKQGFSHHIPLENFKLNFGRYVQTDDVIKYTATSNNNLDIKYSAVHGRTCIFLTDEYYDTLSKRKHAAYLVAISRISGFYTRYQTRRFETYRKAACYLQYVWKKHTGRTRCRMFIVRHIYLKRYSKQLEFIFQQEFIIQQEFDKQQEFIIQEQEQQEQHKQQEFIVQQELEKKQQEQQELEKKQQQEQQELEKKQKEHNHNHNHTYDPLIYPEPNTLLEDLTLCRRQLAIREEEEKQYIACISQLKRERDILIQQIAFLRNECKKGWFHRFFNN
jgi:myosin heavy subunit